MLRQSLALRFLWGQDLSPFVPSRRRNGQGSLLIGHNVGCCGEGRELLVESPSDEKTVATLRGASIGQVDEACQAALTAFKSSEWSRNAKRRCDVLRRISAQLRRERDKISMAEALCSGMCLKDARSSVDSSAACFDAAADMIDPASASHANQSLPPVTFQVGDESYISRSTYEAVGVCGLITPFNYPLEMFAWKAAPALAAGNTIVWKAPEAAPLSSFVLIDLIGALQGECTADSGLPPGVVNIIQGGPDVGAHMASHQLIRLIGFTGSPRTGVEIQCLAAKSNLKRCQLELGGNGCVILAPSFAKNMHTACTIAAQCFSNSGQSCTSSRRVFVPADHLKPFLQGMMRVISHRKLGHALDPSVDQGPMISKASLVRGLEMIRRESSLPGVSLVAGGFRPPFPAGHFCAPTLLLCKDVKSPVVREEMFAPVMCVIPYQTLSEAVRLANDTEYGLSAVVLSNDAAEQVELAAAAEVGNVWINSVDAMNGWTPFGGVKQSGYGRDLGVVATGIQLAQDRDSATRAKVTDKSTILIHQRLKKA